MAVLGESSTYKPEKSRTGLTQFYGERVTTTDATTTQIAALSVAEGEAVVVHGMICGVQSDYSDAIVVHIECGARRASSGDVSLVGTPTVRILESAASTSATVTADTTNQTIDFNVVGIASETWTWEFFGTYFKV